MQLNYELMFGVDKQMHFLSYGLIALLLGIVIIVLSNEHTVNRRIGYIWMVLVSFGVFEEYRQYMVPNRSAEFLDAIANMLGVTTGLIIPLLITYLIKYLTRFVPKYFTIYSMVLISLLVGLIFINERPFVTLPTNDVKRNSEDLGQGVRLLVPFIDLDE
ncbi:hypothetical protein BN1058_00550 [Paraliobacillus sp. PM-2]|uniref:VanZ family protein n=1 Tax=Paraliobacillus sp. PM-2 TaxID=1462524 RepID=UPI00061C0F87|nr:VanZ family protein [Paraliobacillus sp. PM-2]CQR46297.1 hypothetical protein BN1058_00550 [Paraliobacillus sp. PM-2]